MAKTSDFTAQRIEQLVNRANSLNERRTRLAALKESEERRLSELKAELQAKYGTSDLDELRALAVRRQEEFEAAWSSFAFATDKLEAALTEAEQKIRSN